VRLIRTLFQAVKPDAAALGFISIVSCLTTIAGAIAERINEGRVDVTHVMSEVNKLLDRSIAADGFTIRHANNTAVVDLSRIDFAALAKRFAASKTKNVELEQLKAAIRTHPDRSSFGRPHGSVCNGSCRVRFCPHNPKVEMWKGSGLASFQKVPVIWV